MKKIVLLIFVAALTAVGANAQGTWKATGSEPVIPPTTPIETGITGLVVMHNDGGARTETEVAGQIGIMGISDTGATPVTYDGVTWDNLAMIQGVTNGMFYAFAPSSDGTLDIAAKMGYQKPTVVAETDDPIETVAGNVITGSDKAPASHLTNPTYPEVYDTFSQTTNVWDLSKSSSDLQSMNNSITNPAGTTVYLVMSFPVTGGKTYIVSVTGSKFQLRGINYVTNGTGITTPVVDATKGIKSEEYFDLTGRKVLGDVKKAVLIKKTTYIDGTTSDSKIINIW